MSAKISEGDWETALEVFRACLPVRSEKARDHLVFLEAPNFLAMHNVSRRALPERFGNRNSFWKRFDRLSKAAVFEDSFAMRAELSAWLAQLDSHALSAQTPFQEDGFAIALFGCRAIGGSGGGHVGSAALPALTRHL